MLQQKVALVGAARILQNLPGDTEFLCSGELLLVLSADQGESSWPCCVVLTIVSSRPPISVVISSPISVVVSSPNSVAASTEGYTDDLNNVFISERWIYFV